MEETSNKESNKHITLGTKNRNGKIIPLHEQPRMIQAKKQSELASEIANKLSRNDKIIKLYKSYLKLDPHFDTMKITIKRAANDLLSEGLILIREKRAKTDHISNIKMKLEAITKPLKKAQKGFKLLDVDTRNDLSMALHYNNVDLKAISKIIDACESIVDFRESPTNYFIPIDTVFHNFQSHVFDLTFSTQLSNKLSPPLKQLSEIDWNFFKELISHICFEIFSSLENPPESLKDTKSGLKITFEKIKELKPHYFTFDFPD
jgi:hypothetical protein